MKQVWLTSIVALAATFYASSAGAQQCGNGVLNAGEQCDDNNSAAGDGCSASCAVEGGFTCDAISLAAVATGTIPTSITVDPQWVVDADNRGAIQNADTHATIYDTIIPAGVGEIVFDVRVETIADDDFVGWTIGYDPGEMSATSTPSGTDFLLFTWKQERQTQYGADRPSGLGLTRVTGPGSAADYWRGTGTNLAMIAEARNYEIDAGGPNRGWDGDQWYRVNMVVTGTRVRVWLRAGNFLDNAAPDMRGFPALNRVTHLEFDVTLPTVPAGSFGLFAFSQPETRYDLISPEFGSRCGRDLDADGVPNTLDLDSDRDGVLDRVEMPGFANDPDDDTDLDGIADWQDPNDVPGGCTASLGVCTTLTVALDADGDGAPNHLDRDSDGDGLPDTIETGLADITSDGVPDACTTVSNVDVCLAGGLASGALPPNRDGRTVPNYLDLDSDADGVPDALEAGLTDANLDGRPDACAAINAFGMCEVGGLAGAAALPNTDLNGAPDYLDRDSDDDGITDTREAGALDANGDGIPNACGTDSTSGLCTAGGLLSATPNNDADTIPNYIDVDSDGDGLTDNTEAHDLDGNAVSDRPAVAADHDGDGIDNAFDADCTTGVCGLIIGVPVVTPLTVAQDSNFDGTPDWLTVCGDAYITGSEPCDDGNLASNDSCTNMCLATLLRSCTSDAQCASGVCNDATGTCSTCENNSVTGPDRGCGTSLPACLTGSGGTTTCVRCDENTACNDNNGCTTDVCVANACTYQTVSSGSSCAGGVCSGSLPAICETCIDSGAGTDLGCTGAAPNCIGTSGARRCVECTTASQCTDGIACTTDACRNNACVYTAISSGAVGGCTAGQVCSGAPANQCSACADSSATGRDAGCAAGAPHCRVADAGAAFCEPCINTASGSATDLGCSTGSPYCVTNAAGISACTTCLTDGDCNDNNSCTNDVCTAGVCSNPTVTAGESCAGGVCNGATPARCEVCVNSGTGTDTGCSEATPNCVGASGARQCVECTSAAECSDNNACTRDVCTNGACSNPAATAGTACTGGVCGGEASAMCEVCVDNLSGTDSGCSAATPNCVGESGSRRCVGVDGSTEVSIGDPADGSTIRDSSPLIRGTGESGATVVVSLDGTEVGTIVVGSDGTWFLNVSEQLDNGDHTITVEATDAVGNTASGTSMFTIDSNFDVAITTPVYGAVISDTTPTIAGTSLSNASIAITIENSAGDVVFSSPLPIPSESGTWMISETDELGAGLYFVTAVATDAVGNIASDTSTFTVDTETFGAIGSVDPTTGTVSGTGETGSQVVVTINGVLAGMTTVGLDGAWTLDAEGFDVGENLVTATITDLAGNTATDTQSVTVVRPDGGMPDAGMLDGGSGPDDGGESGGSSCATHTPVGASWPSAAGLLLLGVALAIRRRR